LRPSPPSPQCATFPMRPPVVKSETNPPVDHGSTCELTPVSSLPKKRTDEVMELSFMDDWHPVQVKQKDKAGRPDIDSFEAVMMREDRRKGFFVSFDYTSDAEQEIGAFFRRTGKVIVPFTVREIVEGEIARKLV
jgi:hypothetical protein